MAQIDALITLGDPWGNLNAAKNATGYLSCEYEWERRYADCCRAELEQAHGRLRTVHRTRPGRALHVGAVMPGGPKWAGDRVSVRELPPRWPLEMSELSSVQFAAMVKRLGGIRAVGRLIGCPKSTLADYVGGKSEIPRQLVEQVELRLAHESTASGRG